MKCNDCLSSLEEYVDGELLGEDFEQVSSHLVVCQSCSSELETLSAEKGIYARYDRELEIAPSMWQAIATRTASESHAVNSPSRLGLREWLTGLFAVPRFRYAFSGALAVSLIAAFVGLMYLKSIQQDSKPPQIAVKTSGPVRPPENPPVTVSVNDQNDISQGTRSEKNQVEVASTVNPRVTRRSADDPGVLFTEVAYSELAKQDTAEHIQQAENLLRSIRSLQESDEGGEIDVTYEKAMSRRLLTENEVLRQDAEAAGKFPTKELLKDLEPFLIDIANLPDKTTPTQLRDLKERVQKTEIVAALVSYED